jgi:hypothetical protein
VKPAIGKTTVKGRTISYRLSVPAKVSFTVARCTKKCKTVGKFSKQGKAGKNKAKLPKKVGGKRLKAGRYKVTLRPAGGAKKTVTVKIR